RILKKKYKFWGERKMRLRKQDLGDRNLIGHRVESVRKQKGMKQKELLAQLQVSGVDMNASGLSKLEGQIRFVTDVELVALADILEVSVDYLLGRDEKIKN
ncbi:helix-turn-helix domain-containing protein, partial [Ruminococcus sp.]